MTSLSDLNDQLVNVQTQLQRRARLNTLLDATNADLQRTTTRLHDLQTRLQQEDQDVRKLEENTITALFVGMMGNKEERLDTGRQEAVAARLQHDACAAELTALEAEAAELDTKLRPLRDLDTRHQAILSQKEQLLRTTDSPDTRRLFQLSEDLAASQTTLRELDEAIAAGDKVLDGVEAVLQSLRRAGNWGTYDMLGGGFIATAIKHNHVDDARDAAVRVQQALRRFRHELADVQMASRALADIGIFDTFTDFFFDGLIFDWVVQSKIHRSADQTVALGRQVDALVVQLDKQRTQVRQGVRNLKAQRQTLLERAQ